MRQTIFTEDVIANYRNHLKLSKENKLGFVSFTDELLELALEEIEQLQNKISECESALLSMVTQYLYTPLSPKTLEPMENTYTHDFMSAGEEVFAYLVEHGLAEWSNDRHWAIRMKESEGE